MGHQDVYVPIKSLQGLATPKKKKRIANPLLEDRARTHCEDVAQDLSQRKEEGFIIGLSVSMLERETEQFWSEKKLFYSGSLMSGKD